MCIWVAVCFTTSDASAHYYSTAVGVQSIVINPCLSVNISLEPLVTGLIGTILCVQIPCGHGSVLLRRHCATLCTSGFMDDVTFGRNGRDAGRGWQHSASAINYVRDRGGVWCLWMLVFGLRPLLALMLFTASVFVFASSIALLSAFLSSENFVEIDIFYGQLKSEEVVQKVAYDVVSFFSK